MHIDEDLDNHGTLTNEHGATLTNHGGSPNPQPGNPGLPGGMSNAHTMNNHGTLSNHGGLAFITGSSFDNTGGTLENHGVIESSIDNYYQTLKNGLGGTVRFESGSSYTNNLSETIAAGTSLVLEDASGGHNHTFTNNLWLTINSGGELYNQGTLNNGTTIPNFPGQPNIITHHGTIDVDPGSTLTNNHILNNRNGSTLNNHNQLWNATGATRVPGRREPDRRESVRRQPGQREPAQGSSGRRRPGRREPD